MNTPSPLASRHTRRSRCTRAQRLRSFARRGHAGLLVALLPFGVGSNQMAAHAATNNYWTGGAADYNVPAQWSTGLVPNGNPNPIYAVFNGDGTVNHPAGTITHSSSTGVGGVDTIFSFANYGTFNLTGGILAGSQASSASPFVNESGATATINGGTLRNFTISGDALNIANNSNNTFDADVFASTQNINGTVALLLNSLKTTGTAVFNINSNGYLLAANATTVTGTIDFNDGNGNNTFGVDGGSAITLAAGSLVHGNTGQVGVARYVGGTSASIITNNGTISSDGNGTITLNPAGGTSNNGTLQAKNGSTLLLNTSVTNTANGILNVLDTSAIQNNGVTITGGTVTGPGHMTFSGGNNDILSGVTFNGATLDLTNGNNALVTNTLTLTGGSVANIGNNGYLITGYAGNVTLTGTVDFTDGNGNNTLSVENASNLTLSATSLVHGVVGQVGFARINGGAATITNNGTIRSDGGSNITINPAGGLTNNGTLSAVATTGMTPVGSTLTLSAPITNTNGTLAIPDLLSDIYDNGVGVTGGTVTGPGHMTFSGSYANVLTGVTFNGASLDLTNGNIAVFANSLTLQNGSVAKIGANAYLVTANSGGTVNFSGTVDFTTIDGTNIFGVQGGTGITLASGSLVHGITGNVGLARNVPGTSASIVTNNGTISSDGNGTIFLNPAGGTVNNNTLQAKNGSTLRLDSNVTNGAAGILNVLDTSAIQNNGVTITGGTVTGPGHMTFSGGNNDVLAGVTFNGAILDLTNGNNARIANTLTLTGGSVANIGANGYLEAGDVAGATTNTTFSGTVDFTTIDGNNTFSIEGGSTLTLATGSLVHGNTGQVGYARIVTETGAEVLTNNGTISSDGGGTITLNPGGGTSNNGTLQAKNGSTLLLNTSVTNTANGVLNILDTSAIQNNGVTITGGKVTGGGHMTFSGGNNDVLDSVVFNVATLDLTNGNNARILNSLTLTGASVANIANNGYLEAGVTTGFSTPVTISGMVDFIDINGNNTLSVEDNSALTLATGSLVHGVTGQVGYARILTGTSASIVNDGTISSDGGGTITINPSGSLTNNGTLSAVATTGMTPVGSTLTLSAPITNTNGTLAIPDLLSDIYDNGVGVTGGTVTGPGHMTFSNSNGNVLTGVTFSGATLDLTNGNRALVTNTLTLTGGSVANLANNAYLITGYAGNVTLTGTVDFTDGNGNNSLGVENNSVLTLAATSLVHGNTGQVGVARINGGGSIINNGTISSDGGGTITINPVGGMTNNGTLQTKNNSTLTLSAPITNGAAGVINVLDTSNVYDNGVGVTGGTVTGPGHMTFSNSNGNVLTGVTFSGATLDLTNGNRALVTNTLTLTGGSVANLANNAYLITGYAGNVTLTGTVDFSSSDGNNSLGVENSSNLTLGAGSLVHGILGQVGVAHINGGAATITNNGTISSDGGGTITLNPGGSTTNGATGTISANGGTLTVTTPLTNAGGAVLAATGSVMNLSASGLTQSAGTTTANGTINGNLTLTGGKLKGTGTVNGATTVGGGTTAATQAGIDLTDGAIGTLTLQTGAATTALTLGGATAGSFSTLGFDLSNGLSSDTIAIGGSSLLAVNPGGAKVSITGINNFTTGTYTLITFGAGNVTGLANITLASPPNAGGAYSYALTSSTTAEQLVVTAAPTPTTAYWRGDQSSTWNTITNGFTNFYGDAAGTTNVALPGSTTDVIFSTTNVNTANLNTTLGANFSIKSLTFNANSATPATVGGANTLTIGTGGVTVASGAPADTLSTKVLLGTSQAWTNNSTNALTASGVISGSAQLTTSGGGRIILTGANTYSGGTKISNGTLQGTTTSLQGAITDNATLNVTQSTSGTLPSPISGTGAVTANVSAGAIVTMTGANTYAGGTTVSSGTVSGGTANFGTGTVTVSSGATADYTQNAATSYAASITGSGSVTVGGNASSPNGTGGTITYTGADNASGGTTVSSGTLTLSHAGGGALTGPVAIATGGTVGLGAASEIQLASTATTTLSGGTLAANGKNDGTPTASALGKLQLTGPNTSTLDFGDASGLSPTTLSFADSSTLTWTGILTITNYKIGVDQLYIGTSKDLTPDQLNRIRFANDGYPSRQFASGQVVAPEPGGWVSMIVGMGVLGSLIARRRKQAA